jgi:hypothetical protein
MNDDFLNSLYKEERRLFDALLPLYTDYLDVQKLISKRGGQPKCNLGPDGISTVTVQSFIQQLDPEVMTALVKKMGPAVQEELRADNYDKSWIWDRKGEFAFRKLGKFTPKELIDFLCMREEIGVSDASERVRVSGNAYNIISKAYKVGRLRKDETDPLRGVQYELMQEALLMDSKAS